MQRSMDALTFTLPFLVPADAPAAVGSAAVICAAPLTPQEVLIVAARPPVFSPALPLLTCRPNGTFAA